MKVVDTQQIDVNISVMVDELEDGTFRAYSEYAEHIVFTGRTKLEVLSRVLQETAFMMDMEDYL